MLSNSDSKAINWGKLNKIFKNYSEVKRRGVTSNPCPHNDNLHYSPGTLHRKSIQQVLEPNRTEKTALKSSKSLGITNLLSGKKNLQKSSSLGQNLQIIKLCGGHRSRNISNGHSGNNLKLKLKNKFSSQKSPSSFFGAKNSSNNNLSNSQTSIDRATQSKTKLTFRKSEPVEIKKSQTVDEYQLGLGFSHQETNLLANLNYKRNTWLVGHPKPKNDTMDAIPEPPKFKPKQLLNYKFANDVIKIKNGLSLMPKKPQKQTNQASFHSNNTHTTGKTFVTLESDTLGTTVRSTDNHRNSQLFASGLGPPIEISQYYSDSIKTIGGNTENTLNSGRDSFMTNTFDCKDFEIQDNLENINLNKRMKPGSKKLSTLLKKNSTIRTTNTMTDVMTTVSTLPNFFTLGRHFSSRKSSLLPVLPLPVLPGTPGLVKQKSISLEQLNKYSIDTVNLKIADCDSDGNLDLETNETRTCSFESLMVRKPMTPVDSVIKTCSQFTVQKSFVSADNDPSITCCPTVLDPNNNDIPSPIKANDVNSIFSFSMDHSVDPKQTVNNNSSKTKSSSKTIPKHHASFFRNSFFKHQENLLKSASNGSYHLYNIRKSCSTGGFKSAAENDDSEGFFSMEEKAIDSNHRNTTSNKFNFRKPKRYLPKRLSQQNMAKLMVENSVKLQLLDSDVQSSNFDVESVDQKSIVKSDGKKSKNAVMSNSFYKISEWPMEGSITGSWASLLAPVDRHQNFLAVERMKNKNDGLEVRNKILAEMIPIEIS